MLHSIKLAQTWQVSPMAKPAIDAMAKPAIDAIFAEQVCSHLIGRRRSLRVNTERQSDVGVTEPSSTSQSFTTLNRRERRTCSPPSSDPASICGTSIKRSKSVRAVSPPG
jgi:hypothetical protein